MAELLFTNHVEQALDRAVEALAPNGVFVLVDSNTASFVLPRLQGISKAVGEARAIVIPPGDDHKDVSSLGSIWQELSDKGATRSSVLINLGGGVVTDIGAFAASTFKRGMKFINVPTSLLGAVDASVGGKTGINFAGLKNEVGLFSNAELTIISTTFFNTLTSQQLLDGYAEMLKHALISSPEMTSRLLAYNITGYSPEPLLNLLKENVGVKVHYVEADPEDRGCRHALNFGHTFGHAFESMALQRGAPLAHGYAVAFGMVAALILSHLELDFPTEWLNRYVTFVKKNYGGFAFDCRDTDRLIALMQHDKKNTTPDSINFTLLRGVGEVEINRPASHSNIRAALEIYRDMVL